MYSPFIFLGTLIVIIQLKKTGFILKGLCELEMKHYGKERLSGPLTHTFALRSSGLLSACRVPLTFFNKH